LYFWTNGTIKMRGSAVTVIKALCREFLVYSRQVEPEFFHRAGIRVLRSILSKRGERPPKTALTDDFKCCSGSPGHDIDLKKTEAG
jgi:hypothetical protein